MPAVRVRPRPATTRRRKRPSKAVSTTRNGSVGQITGFKATKTEEQQGASATQRVQKSTGKSYVNTQTVCRLRWSCLEADRGARATEAPGAPATDAKPPAADPELGAARERLTERFALMQSELGGLFYEMAIRDHVQMDVLIEKAAALQRVDAELAQIEHLAKRGRRPPLAGIARTVGRVHARGAAFCCTARHLLTQDDARTF